MAKFEIEFDVTCDTCGESLDYSEHGWGLELKVILCTRCLTEKNAHIQNLLETHEEDTNTMQENIDKLNDEIESLKIRLTFNSINKR